jgi:hypothetical protein
MNLKFSTVGLVLLSLVSQKVMAKCKVVDLEDVLFFAKGSLRNALKVWLKKLNIKSKLDWSKVTADQLDAIVSACLGVWYFNMNSRLPSMSLT